MDRGYHIAFAGRKTDCWMSGIVENCYILCLLVYGIVLAAKRKGKTPGTTMCEKLQRQVAATGVVWSELSVLAGESKKSDDNAGCWARGWHLFAECERGKFFCRWGKF